MADEFLLKYGGREVLFRKSEDMVAVRPHRNRDGAVADAMRTDSDGHLTGEVLGSFKLARLTSSRAVNEAQLDAIRSNEAVAVGSHVFHTADAGTPFVPTGSLFVRFKAGASAEERGELLRDLHLELMEARGPADLLVRVTPLAENPVKTAMALQQHPLVEVAEPEFLTRGKLTSFVPPKDELLDAQWHLRNTGFHRGTATGFRSGADAKVVDAWTEIDGLGSSDVVVAVIDDGFDLRHPDLGPQARISAPWDFESNTADASPRQGDWHGTACAGVAVAASGAGQVIGVAPAARLMPLRWSSEISDTSIERWFRHAERNGAWIVSCSWQGEARHFALSTRMTEAISSCCRNGRGGKGCVVVFAAGNESSDVDDGGSSLNGFATHPDVVAVSASTSMDIRSTYSNFGAAISICAPSSGAGGWGILTTDVTGVSVVDGIELPLGYADGDYDFDFGGTSSACPLVAGVCALVLTVNPSLTSAEVKSILQQSARKIGVAEDYVQGHSRYFGYGCVDAKGATALAKARLAG